MDDQGPPIDTSSVIYLAKAGAFEDACRCVGSLRIPPAVWREAVEAGEARGAPEVAEIRVAVREGRLELATPSARIARRAREIASRHALGSGESEVLALARRGGRVIVDEARATRVAESLGLTPISTLFLPVLGVAEGRLALTAARELLHRLAGVTGARADVVLRLEQALRRYGR